MATRAETFYFHRDDRSNQAKCEAMRQKLYVDDPPLNFANIHLTGKGEAGRVEFILQNLLAGDNDENHNEQISHPLPTIYLHIERIGGDSMGSEDWEAVRSCLKSPDRCNLKELAVTWMADISSKGMSTIVESIGPSTKLEELDLSFSSWHPSLDEVLVQALQKNCLLEGLHLRACGLDDARVALIVSSLEHHPSLRSLNLTDNHCGEKTSTALANMLRSSATKLRHLYLAESVRSSRTHRDREKLNIGRLASSLKQNNSLRLLNLQGCGIDDGDVSNLGSILIRDESNNQYNTSLEDLDLFRNRITNEGLLFLIRKCLPFTQGLKELDLDGNLWLAPDDPNNISQSSTKSDHDSIRLYKLFTKFVKTKDVSLFKAIGHPVEIPLGLWPLILHKVQSKPISDAPSRRLKSEMLYLLMRGPIVQALCARR